MGKRFNSFKRKFWLFTMILTFLATLCACPDPNPPKPQNKAPETTIVKEGEADGQITYNISGTDQDGYVSRIDYNINGESSSKNSDNFSVTVPLTEGDQYITATSIDNEGAADETPATHSCYSPTEYEASSIIEGTLNPSTYNSLEKDVLISVGDSDSFIVNALINKKSNGTDAIIDYLSTQEVKDILDIYGIPNLCIMNRTSTENLESQVETFQNNDYNNPSKTRTKNPKNYIIVPNIKTPELNDYIIVPENANN